MGKRRSVNRILVGKPEGNRPLRSPRRRWEGNIKANVQDLSIRAWTRLSWFRIGKAGGVF